VHIETGQLSEAVDNFSAALAERRFLLSCRSLRFGSFGGYLAQDAHAIAGEPALDHCSERGGPIVLWSFWNSCISCCASAVLPCLRYRAARPKCAWAAIALVFSSSVTRSHALSAVAFAPGNCRACISNLDRSMQTPSNGQRPKKNSRRNRPQPGSAEAAYRLGGALLQQGKAHEALRKLERSDELKPDMPETLYSLGKAASLDGDRAR